MSFKLGPFIAVSVVCLALTGYISYKSTSPTDAVTNQKMLAKMQTCLTQVHISDNRLPYEVYVLTPGFSDTKLQWDGCGTYGDATHFNWQDNKTGITYNLSESAESPTNWRIEGQSKTNLSLALEQSTSGTPVPWEKEKTLTGKTYYQWREMDGYIDYYFEEGQTYVSLRLVGHMQPSNVQFPAAIISHMRRLGNPVQHADDNK